MGLEGDMEHNDGKFIATAASYSNEDKRHTPDEIDRKRVASPVEGRPAKRVLTKDGKMVQPDAPPPNDTVLGLDSRGPVSEDPDLSIQDQASIEPDPAQYIEGVRSNEYQNAWIVYQYDTGNNTSFDTLKDMFNKKFEKNITASTVNSRYRTTKNRTALGPPNSSRRKSAEFIEQARQRIYRWKMVERLGWEAIGVRVKEILKWNISMQQIKNHYYAHRKGSKQKIEENVNNALAGVELGLLPSWAEVALSQHLNAARKILSKVHEGTTGTEEGGNDVDNQGRDVITSEADLDGSWAQFARPSNQSPGMDLSSHSAHGGDATVEAEETNT